MWVTSVTGGASATIENDRSFYNLKFLIYLIAIIYRTYDPRGVDVPYFRSVMTVLLSIFFHAVQIALLFDLPSTYVMPWNSKGSTSSQWLGAPVFIGSLIAILLLLFPMKKVESIEVTDKVVNRARSILPIYLAVNLCLLIFLLIKKSWSMHGT